MLPVFGSGKLYFYPRPPRGGRPRCLVAYLDCSKISIHALREEGDVSTSDRRRSCRYFYPRPPRGGRPRTAETQPCAAIFLSTPSARRATPARPGKLGALTISIHALREEGDPSCSSRAAGASYFYPRPPRGGRRWRKMYIDIDTIISIHALREEGD